MQMLNSTVGRKILMSISGQGMVLFAIVHWLCDLGWLEVLSVAGYQGSQVLGRRAQEGPQDLPQPTPRSNKACTVTCKGELTGSFPFLA